MTGIGYIRVSSRTQVKEGVSLDVQRYEVTELLKKKGCNKIKIFADEGKSARTIEGRDEFIKALDYAIKEKVEYFAVYDTSRFARNVGDATSQLRKLNDNGTELICVTQSFDKTPEGKLVFGIFASLDEYASTKSGKKIKDSIGELHKQGRFPHTAPLGYKNIRHESGKADIIIHPQYGKIIQQALKDYAYGKLRSELEVALFLHKSGVQHKWLRIDQKRMHSQLASRLLNKPFYYGYFYDGIEKVMRKHVYPTLITKEEFDLIQKRLGRVNKGKALYNNPELKEKFPLSDGMFCPICGKKFIGYKSKGRKQYYYYYDCKTKGCSGAISTEKIHSKYLKVLEEIAPKNDAIKDLFKEVFLEVFKEQSKGAIEETKQHENALQAIRKKQQDILDLLPTLGSPNLVRDYERQYENLSVESKEMEENVKTSPTNPSNFEPLFEHAYKLLKNPVQTWDVYGTSEKRRFHDWIFINGIQYSSKEGFRTADICLTYKLISMLNKGDTHLVETVGIEPTSKSNLHYLYTNIVTLLLVINILKSNKKILILRIKVRY